MWRVVGLERLARRCRPSRSRCRTAFPAGRRSWRAASRTRARWRSRSVAAGQPGTIGTQVAGILPIAAPTERASLMPSPRMLSGAMLPKSSGSRPRNSSTSVGVPVVRAGREHHRSATLDRAVRAPARDADDRARRRRAAARSPVSTAGSRCASSWSDAGEEPRDHAGAERQRVGSAVAVPRQPNRDPARRAACSRPPPALENMSA